jgi:hypothetical protein
MNAFRLAFKTYNVSEFNEMIKVVAGGGGRVTGADTSEQLRQALLEGGFVIFPAIADAEDGYVRVIRANSIVGNLLNAFRYVGQNGDEELAKLLSILKRRTRPDDLDAATDAATTTT